MQYKGGVPLFIPKAVTKSMIIILAPIVGMVYKLE